MILENVKIRNTEVENSPFDGIIMTACSKDEGLEIDLSNPILFENIEGVLLDGSWYKRMLDFVEILKFIQEHNLKVFIETELSMDEFQTRLGLAGYNKVNNMNLVRQDISPNDVPMIQFMGSALLNYYLTHTDYHIASKEKSGYKLNLITLPKDDEDGE